MEEKPTTWYTPRARVTGIFIAARALPLYSPAPRQRFSGAAPRPNPLSATSFRTSEAKRPEPSPELKATLDDMRRRYRAGRERLRREPEGKDAA